MTCKALDDGTVAGQSACFSCFQQDCQGGSQDLASDYCQVPGCGAAGCSTTCTDCLNQYTGAGQMCDASGGTVGACCTSDPVCSLYLSDVTTNCP